jgi:hypothetical protein
MLTTRDILVHEEGMRGYMAEAQMQRLALAAAPAPSAWQSLRHGLSRLLGRVGQSWLPEQRSGCCPSACC